MRNIIQFLIRYHFILLFLVLQTVAITLIISYNSFQRAVTLNSVDNFTDRIYQVIDRLVWYLDLREENIELAKENNKLKNYIERNVRDTETVSREVKDTTENLHYYYTSAKVINNSTNKQYNYLVLNKGESSGIKPYSAVTSPNGVVGLVIDVTSNFSKVMSLLNLNFSLSAKIKKNGYYGNLHWNGKSSQSVILDDIPYHVPISYGDTIITSGYSEFFPEGIVIGTIKDFRLKGGNFYEIEVALSNDFRSLSNVYVIENLMKSELELLQSKQTEVIEND